MAESWVTEYGVPVFRPHVRKDEAGKALYEVTSDDIPLIAKNSANLTVELHGNKPPITEGHRDFSPEAREANQPLVLGYMDNFRDGMLDGVPVVLCDRHYMSQYAEQAKRHPYCSVDYIHARKAIVGLAKLTRPPALNLGGMFYPGTGEPVYIYSMGTDKVDTKPDGEQPKPAAPQAPAQPVQPEPGAEGDTPELTPEEIQGCEKVYKYLCSKYQWMGAAAQQYDASQAGQPAGGNTAPPKELPDENEDGDDDKKKKPSKDKPDMSQATVSIEQYTATQEQLAKLIAEREAEKVDRILDTLEKVEHYQFDRKSEAERFLTLSEAGRTARADEIRKYHSKLEGANRVEVYQGMVGKADQPTSREVSDKAVKYASKHGVSYDDGLAAVKAGKN